jgi:hypothetical protein
MIWQFYKVSEARCTGPTNLEIGVALEDLERGHLAVVVDVPVVDGPVGDETQLRFAYPLPEDDLLLHGEGLELGLVRQVEDLNGVLLGAERDDGLLPLHDGTVGLDGAAHDIVVVLQVDDDDLGLGSLAHLLADAEVVVGFKRL